MAYHLAPSKHMQGGGAAQPCHGREALTRRFWGPVSCREPPGVCAHHIKTTTIGAVGSHHSRGLSSHRRYRDLLWSHLCHGLLSSQHHYHGHLSRVIAEASSATFVVVASSATALAAVSSADSPPPVMDFCLHNHPIIPPVVPLPEGEGGDVKVHLGPLVGFGV
jgi:hypothetical protein